MNPSIWKPLLFMLILALMFNLLYSTVVSQTATQSSEITYSRFRQELAADNIKYITLKGNSIKGEFRSRTKVSQMADGKETVRDASGFNTILPSIPDPGLMSDLTAKKVEVKALSTEPSPLPLSGPPAPGRVNVKSVGDPFIWSADCAGPMPLGNEP